MEDDIHSLSIIEIHVLFQGGQRVHGLYALLDLEGVQEPFGYHFLKTGKVSLTSSARSNTDYMSCPPFDRHCRIW